MVKFFSKHEAMNWCAENKFALNDRGFPDCSSAEQKFDIPIDAQKRVALVKRIMGEFVNSTNLLIWYDDWMVWESGQWMPLVLRLRESYGEGRKLIDIPAQLFGNGEIEDATSFVVIAVLFLFDCYIICSDQRRIIHFSHDEWGLAKTVPLRPTDFQ
ncbi:MAG TPA: hypothetical protein VFB02_04435 [Bradyrhizobium sp.]|nr:hypothetical protein [Bradyrhizobium sp.]